MTIAEMRKMLGISRAGFGRKYNIPIRTLEDWEAGKRTPPEYVMSLLERCVREDREKIDSSALMSAVNEQAEQAKQAGLTEDEIINNRYL